MSRIGGLTVALTKTPEMETEMFTELEDDGSLRYQRWLAQSLVANLGYDRALQICSDLRWLGTLAQLARERAAAQEPRRRLARAS